VHEKARNKPSDIKIERNHPGFEAKRFLMFRAKPVPGGIVALLALFMRRNSRST
jgi:hypothetical protein